MSNQSKTPHNAARNSAQSTTTTGNGYTTPANSAQLNGTPAPTGPELNGAATWPVPDKDEHLLIQCLATGNDGAAAVFSRLSNKQFKDEWARRFYQAAQGLHEQKKPINPKTLADACVLLADAADRQSEVEAWEYAAEIARGEELTWPRDVGNQNPAVLALTIADKIADKTAPPFEVFTFADLAKLPRPQWLIRGLLIEKTTSVLTADTGSYKSFFALDMALCIATGRPFFGREVKRGPVVYVAAEGFYTMRDRATAWADFHGVQLPQNFHILKVPVNVSDAVTAQRFTDHFRELAPIFAVLDTLNQCAIGLNENSNDEMARFMAGMAATGAALDAHVETVHHNAKASGNFRGAGAIKNNVDTHISLDRPADDETNTVFVRCEKQRGRPFDAFTLRGQEITLPYCDEFGDEITSLVFEATGEPVKPKTAKHPNAQRADSKREELLKLFDDLAEETPDGVKIGTWKDAAENAGLFTEKSSGFWNYLKAFKGEGENQPTPEIERCGTHNGSELWARCVLNPTTPTTPNSSYRSDRQNLTPPSTPTTPTTPLGVGVIGVGEDGAKKGVKTQRSAKAKKGAAAANSEPYHAIKVASDETANSEIRDGAL